MSLTAILLELGFERQEDLGINLASVGKYFQFDGHTHAIDEEGVTWLREGRINLNEFLHFSPDPDPSLWGSRFAVPHYGVKFARAAA